MARITLLSDEAAPGVLPPVCMVCGRSAAERVAVAFSWVPPWSYLLLMAGWLPWAFVYVRFRRAVTFEAPTCRRHQYHWLVRRSVLPVGLGLTLALLLAPGFLNPGGPFPPAWAFDCSLVVLAMTAVVAFWSWRAGVRTESVGGESVSLAGVAPGFVEAVEAGRADYKRRMRDWLNRREGSPDEREAGSREG